MNYINTVHKISSFSAPPCHEHLSHTFNNFYLKSKVSSALNIMAVKSKRDHYAEIDTISRKSPVYVNDVRKAKHFPPANKE